VVGAAGGVHRAQVVLPVRDGPSKTSARGGSCCMLLEMTTTMTDSSRQAQRGGVGGSSHRSFHLVAQRMTSKHTHTHTMPVRFAADATGRVHYDEGHGWERMGGDRLTARVKRRGTRWIDRLSRKFSKRHGRGGSKPLPRLRVGTRVKQPTRRDVRTARRMRKRCARDRYSHAYCNPDRRTRTRKKQKKTRTPRTARTRTRTGRRTRHRH
jgi:hypothetical protein